LILSLILSLFARAIKIRRSVSVLKLIVALATIALFMLFTELSNGLALTMQVERALVLLHIRLAVGEISIAAICLITFVFG